MKHKHEYSAGGVIVRDGKVLTISWNTVDYVCFPKGHIDSGESSQQAALREVFEETGYHAEIISLIGSTTYDRLEYSEPYRKTVEYYLMKLVDDTEPTPHRLPGEDFENLWLTFDEARDRLKYDDAREMLRRAQMLSEEPAPKPMKKVAKVVIVDDQDKLLLLHRSPTHPIFGVDPDVPGGTLEPGEEPVETMIREVQEEAGITIEASDVELLYKSTHYSPHGTEYSLFFSKLPARPEVTLSWEHSSYEWLGRDEFLEKAKHSKDDFMHMVHDAVV